MFLEITVYVYVKVSIKLISWLQESLKINSISEVHQISFSKLPFSYSHKQSIMVRPVWAVELHFGQVKSLFFV